jgi:hypothetical protein
MFKKKLNFSPFFVKVNQKSTNTTIFRLEDFAMPRINIGSMGFSLVFTARIPPQAQSRLKRKSENEIAAFDLTPAWGEVPSLLVSNLRRAGIGLPDHWAGTNEVYPVIHGMAFYIVPYIPTGMAASFSMQGVNLRTGKAEELQLTDKPCQSYWTTKVHVPWIDGYRPNHTEAVRQFVPLRGEAEMASDISDFVGISNTHPWKDGITAGFFLPTDFSKLGSTDSGMRGGPYPMYYEVLESMSYGEKGEAFRSASRSSEPERVGIGAGALMRQQHPDVPGVKAKDYFDEALLRLTARIVWVEQWNAWAREIGETMIAASRLRQLEDMQADYEARLWSRLGGNPVNTDVDSFPSPE